LEGGIKGVRYFFWGSEKSERRICKRIEPRVQQVPRVQVAHPTGLCMKGNEYKMNCNDLLERLWEDYVLRQENNENNRDGPHYCA